MDNKIISALLEIEKEQQKRSASPIEKYNKGKLKHKKQMAFHKCKKKVRFVFGGNRSGKTECGAVEAIYLARGIHPFRKNKDNVFGWVVSLSTQVQRDVAQKKILSYLRRDWILDIVMISGSKQSPESGIIDQIIIKNVFGGRSIIGFKSCDQGREKFQGASLDFVWFDEEPPYDVYSECRMRVVDKCGDIFATMTPLKGLTFAYTDIYLQAGENIWCIFFEWGDNPFLSKNQVQILSQSLSGDELESRKYGRFASGEGLVYPEFDPSVHIIEPFIVPPEWQDNISIDPGLNNPLSAHWYAVDFDGTVYVIAEHYQAKMDINYHAAQIKSISKNLNWHTDSKGRICALIDSAANQRTLASSKSVSELFYDLGILVNANVDKNLFSGISRVKSYLKGSGGKPKLYIFKTCTNLIKEIKGYWWGKADAPVKKDDHALDDLRYYIMTKPQAAKEEIFLSEIQKDKERLMRKLRKR